MDGSFMGIYIVDTDWHILYVNQAFLDLFGYKNIDEVRASPPHEHYTPEEYARHLVRNERRLHVEPNPDQFELDILHKDGTIRHLQAFRKEVLWDGKQQSQLLYNDITARKVTEETLKVSEQNFRNSLNGSLMGIYITDKNWHPLYANQAFLDMFGYENNDEVGASPPHEHYTPESHAALILRQERQLHGEPAPDKFEIAIVRKDNSIRHLQIFRKEILWNGEKQHQLFYNDITERKIVEDALKKSETMYHELMNTITSGVFIYKAVDNGENFVCVDVNNSAEKMEGINLQISSASG
jgi:PAS domain S-box-containing protein